LALAVQIIDMGVWVRVGRREDEKGTGSATETRAFSCHRARRATPPPAFLRFATGSHPHRRRVSRVRVVDATRLLRNQKAGVEYGGRDTRRPTIWGCLLGCIWPIQTYGVQLGCIGLYAGSPSAKVGAQPAFSETEWSCVPRYTSLDWPGSKF
jgi:hypothetical protein